jgi:uncharacterized protein (DUF1501 family)
MTPSQSQRRRWLQQLAAAGALATLGPAARLSLAATPARTGRSDAPDQRPRLVLVILRGGLDGLAAVPPLADPALAEARSALVPAGARPLDALFSLHPALPQLHALYARRELLVLHAVGLPYRDRSHFDAQQVLESGGSRPFELDTGWLGRALAGNGQTGMAFQSAVPLVLRGHAGVDTWAPSTQAEPAGDLLDRLQRLYAHDPALAGALLRARELRLDGLPAMADDAGMAAGQAGQAAPPGAPAATPATGRRGAAEQLARQAAGFIARPGGPQAAVLEMGGWDSHALQGADTGTLATNLQRLDQVLAALRDGLTAPDAGSVWQRTAVLVVTEFGRTVAVNGTQGTDHGTGAAAFLLGGAVAGGRVLADWPGLAPHQRHEGRDLRVTTDLRAVFKTLLQQHLGLAPAVVAQSVLPGSAALPLLPLLSA